MRRRAFIQTVTAGALAGHLTTARPERKGRLKQAVCRGVFRGAGLDFEGMCREAARRGVIEGGEWPPTGFYASGHLTLVPWKARAEAEAFLLDALSRRGIVDYEYDIRVVPGPTGGTVPGFPPVLRAAQDGREMHVDGPGVGVYLEFSVPTVWLGLISRGEYRIHVFAAAEIREMGP